MLWLRVGCGAVGRLKKSTPPPWLNRICCWVELLVTPGPPIVKPALFNWPPYTSMVYAEAPALNWKPLSDRGVESAMDEGPALLNSAISVGTPALQLEAVPKSEPAPTQTLLAAIATAA